jgi:hypothetical protein
MADGIPVDSTKVFIDLEGWKGYTYTRYEDTETQQPLPKNILTTAGALYTPPKVLNDFRNFNTHYFVEFLNIHDFEISGDYMALETRFRNKHNFDYQLCFDMWFKIIGTDGVLKMHFLRNGCAGFVQMIFGEKSLDGHKQDLSMFTQDFQHWKTARMEVADKNVTIYILKINLYSLPPMNSL